MIYLAGEMYQANKTQLKSKLKPEFRALQKGG